MGLKYIGVNWREHQRKTKGRKTDVVQGSTKCGSTDNFAQQTEQLILWEKSLTLEKLYLAVQLCSQGMRVPEASECDGELCEVALAGLAG